jgi:hypothetical protein
MDQNFRSIGENRDKISPFSDKRRINQTGALSENG